MTMSPQGELSCQQCEEQAGRSGVMGMQLSVEAHMTTFDKGSHWCAVQNQVVVFLTARDIMSALLLTCWMG